MNKNLPLVSVVIPFKNEERFLGQTVESVINQDYENWELLLIDDGSTNESTTIAKNFAAKYPGKIFYLEHPNHQNKGCCASRNLGVEKARGDLIAPLDADDVWLPGKLSSQVSIFQKHPDVSMVMETSNYWTSWDETQTKKNGLVEVGLHGKVPLEKVYDPIQLLFLLYPLAKGATPSPSAVLIKKSAIQRIGGFEESFIKEYQLYEDIAFFTKFFLEEKSYISSACNTWYRLRQGSVVQWVNEKGHYPKVRKHFLEWFQNYLQHKNIRNKKLKWLLWKALMPYHHPVIYFITQTAPQTVWKQSKKAIPVPVKRLIKKQFSHKK